MRDLSLLAILAILLFGISISLVDGDWVPDSP